MRPPFFLRIRIQEPGERPFRLWLPLILIWALVGLLALLLSPIIVCAILIMMMTEQGRRMLIAIGVFFEALTYLRGLRIDVSNPRRGSRVLIDVV